MKKIQKVSKNPKIMKKIQKVNKTLKIMEKIQKMKRNPPKIMKKNTESE